MTKRRQHPGLRWPTALLLVTCCAVIVPSALAIDEIGDYTVRCAYLIPNDRSAQANAEAYYQDWFMLGREWYADQMERYGFGDSDLDYTFRLEDEGDGETPVIHFVYLSEDRDDLLDVYGNGDPGLIYDAALDAGVPVDSDEEIWVLVAHLHEMQSDGSIEGGIALGSPENGVAYLSGGSLAFSTSFLTNDDEYDGVTHLPLGPYEMVQDVTWAWWQGDVFSRVTACTVYGWMHELGHAFTLAHCPLNDLDLNDTLMGTGTGGYRGWLNPGSYSNNYMHLCYGTAAFLNISPYFTSPAVVSDEYDTPSVNVTTSGNVTPHDGVIDIAFTASDGDGLAFANLYTNGELVGSMELSGTYVSTQFETAWWTAGENNDYQVEVWDADGNREDCWNHNTTVYPATGYNEAPIPNIRIWPTTADVDETVTLNGSGSYDPDWSPGYLDFEWDVDGDGTYDIGPSTNDSATTSYDTAGSYLIYLRVTDSEDGQSVSSPFVIVVEGEGGGGTLLDDGFETSFDNWTDGGTTDWDRTTSQKHSGSYSAHAGSNDNDLISDNLDTSGASSITIEFYYRDDDIDSGEALLRLYNGSSYATKADLGTSTEDTWNYYTTTIYNSGGDAQYFVSNFRIMFEASSLDYGENLWIDDVLVTIEGGGGDTDPPTPNPATFYIEPTLEQDGTSVSMQATAGSDASPPVEYYFDETSGNPGGTDSGWTTNVLYFDWDLVPGYTYTYTVTMRDSLNNVGTASDPVNIYIPPQGGGELLDDGFEVSFDNWTDGGTTDWDRTTSQKHSGSYSAHAGYNDNDLISDNLDTSGQSSITIEFWYRDDDIDSGEALLQLYNGSSYATKADLGTSTEDTWNYYTTTIYNSGGDAQYFISNFRIKFEASSLDYGWWGQDENLWIDDVIVSVE
jgi:hypothetical protein